MAKKTEEKSTVDIEPKPIEIDPKVGKELGEQTEELFENLER